MKTGLMCALMAAYPWWAPTPLFAAVTISVNDVTVTEGGKAQFLVTLSQKSSRTITIGYQTRNGSAGFNLDFYNVAAGVSFFPPLEFKPGEVSKVVSVRTINDTCQENTENFFLDLFNLRET